MAFYSSGTLRSKLGVAAEAAKRSVLDFLHDASRSESSDNSGNDSSDSSSDDESMNAKELLGIKELVDMAAAAYSDTSIAGRFPSSVRTSQLITNLASRTELYRSIRTDTEVHVCVLHDGSLAFTFRGTESSHFKSFVADFATNMMIEQTPLELYNASDTLAYRARPHIKAHKGFQLALRDVTKTSRPMENIRLVAEKLGAQTPNVQRVICIGHSLGGALATLCAHWCRYVAYPKAEIWCVTIGSPRVGNKAFACDFNRNVVTKGRSYRVVNKADLIPYVPSFSINFHKSDAYKHVHGLIHLSEHPTTKNMITLKRGGKPGPILRHTDSFKDHSADAYNESMRWVLARFPHLYHHHTRHLPPSRHPPHF